MALAPTWPPAIWGHPHRIAFAVRECTVQLGRYHKARASWSYTLPDVLPGSLGIFGAMLMGGVAALGQCRPQR